MSKVMELTQENFAELVRESSVPVLVDFWAAWCGPCKTVAPLVENMAENNTEIGVGKIDIDAHPQLAAEFGVRSIPTLIMFIDGEAVATRLGSLSAAELESFVQQKG